MVIGANIDVLHKKSEMVLGQLATLAEGESLNHTEHCSIDTVMYCVALAPNSLQRKPWEQEIEFN